MRTIKEVSHIGDYKLLLKFDNNVKKIVDLESKLNGEIFKPLQDKEFFKLVKIYEDLDTIYWPNGADICPDTLYEIGEEYQKTA